MTRTRIEQTLNERLKALRKLRDVMLRDAETDEAAAYAYAVYSVRVAVEKWLAKNQGRSPALHGASLMGAAIQVIQTALLVSSNDPLERADILGKAINHTVTRLIEGDVIMSPQKARAHMALASEAKSGRVLGPDGKPVRVQ